MTPTAGGIAVIGVGSAHGDDQFGWAVVDRLASSFPTARRTAGGRREPPACGSCPVRFAKVTSPVDLIQELDHHSRMIIVDAAVGLPADVWCQRLSFTNAGDRSLMQEVSNHGTHDFGLYLALRLAESLGKRTDHVGLWIGNANKFERFSALSPSFEAAAERCATAISKECCDARMVVG